MPLKLHTVKLIIVRVGHRQIFYIDVPHTHRQTYRQTDILDIPKF